MSVSIKRRALGINKPCQIVDIVPTDVISSIMSLLNVDEALRFAACSRYFNCVSRFASSSCPTMIIGEQYTPIIITVGEEDKYTRRSGVSNTTVFFLVPQQLRISDDIIGLRHLTNVSRLKHLELIAYGGGVDMKFLVSDLIHPEHYTQLHTLKMDVRFVEDRDDTKDEHVWRWILALPALLTLDTNYPLHSDRLFTHMTEHNTQSLSSIRNLSIVHIENIEALWVFRNVETFSLYTGANDRPHQRRILVAACTVLTRLTNLKIDGYSEDDIHTIATHTLPLRCTTFTCYFPPTTLHLFCEAKTFRQLTTLIVNGEGYLNDVSDWSLLSILDGLRTLDMRRTMLKTYHLLPILPLLETFYAPNQLPYCSLKSTKTTLRFPNLVVLGLQNTGWSATTLPSHPKLRTIKIIEEIPCVGVLMTLILYHKNGGMPIIETIEIPPPPDTQIQTIGTPPYTQLYVPRSSIELDRLYQLCSDTLIEVDRLYQSCPDASVLRSLPSSFVDAWNKTISMQSIIR